MPTRSQAAEVAFLPDNSANAQRVAVLNRQYDISIHYAEIPEPREGEVRVKVKWTGICGSDLEAYRGTRAPEFLTTPARLGHEVAGIIDKIGPNVNGLKVGARVVCRYIWGGFAQYLTCRPFNVKRIPENVDMEHISLIEILPGVLHAAELSQIDQAKNVLIMGQGVSGLVLTQVIRLHNPRNLVVTDLHESKLAIARKYGASHTYRIPSPETSTMAVLGKDFPDGFDVVIPCLLDGDKMIDAIDCCTMCGRIVMYGCIGVCKEPLDFFKVHRKRLEIYSTEPRTDLDNRRYFQEGVQMVSDGLVNTGEIVTHVFPLARIQDAFKLRDTGGDGVIHVLIDCEG